VGWVDYNFYWLECKLVTQQITS